MRHAYARADTEIDWIAYMQEVRGFLVDGETDYLNLRGDTGPLVYPGGFVWIFSALYYMTDEGKNLRRGEYIEYIYIYICDDFRSVPLRLHQVWSH